MPGGDQTGPRGMGPMTGRRAGYCAGYGGPGFANPAYGGYGRGWGQGWGSRGFARGGGRGWRHRYYATGRPAWLDFGPPPWAYGTPPTHDQELEGLKREAEWLQGQLDDVGRRIEELEK